MHAQANQLVKVLQKLGQDVKDGKVSVQQAQADLQFAEADVDTKAAPWSSKSVAQAIVVAKQHVALRQLQARFGS